MANPVLRSPTAPEGWRGGEGPPAKGPENAAERANAAEKQHVGLAFPYARRNFSFGFLQRATQAPAERDANGAEGPRRTPKGGARRARKPGNE